MTLQCSAVTAKIRNTLFALCLASAGTTLLNCYDVREEADGETALIPAVETVQARHGSLPLTERLTGVVRARNQIAIYPEINATIIEVKVENGQVVDKGQPLVRLRDREFQEQLKQAGAGYKIALAQAKQAEAQLKEIEAELRRTEALAQKKLTSDTELETIRTRAVSAEATVELAYARVEQARATMDERQENLSQTVIKAPVSGTVGNRNAEVGMLVSSGTRLFTLGQLDCVRVEVVLTDRMLNYIEKGQRTEILADNSVSGSVSSSLSRISPFLHPVTHSTDAEIDLANPDGRLRPGMFVAVDVHYGESEQATLVPLSALYENPITGGTGVYVTRGSIAGETDGETNGHSQTLTEPIPFEFVPVDVIAKGRLHAGIRGIEEGQWVVTIGQDLLGGQSGKARARPIRWERIEQLQMLQRQDLLQEIMKRQQAAREDTSSMVLQNLTAE